MIPNFVDTEAIVPLDGPPSIGSAWVSGTRPVVMYAGNVGFSQSLDLMLHAAREMPEVVFVINGEGAARPSLEDVARDLPNVRIAGYVAKDQLSDPLLASADLHVVPLKAGLGKVSVPSKTYSILASGRPVLAYDPGTEVPRILEASGAGESIAPDDPEAFVTALRRLLGRGPPVHGVRQAVLWVETAVSPAAVGQRYDGPASGR